VEGVHECEHHPREHKKCGGADTSMSASYPPEMAIRIHEAFATQVMRYEAGQTRAYVSKMCEVGGRPAGRKDASPAPVARLRHCGGSKAQPPHPCLAKMPRPQWDAWDATSPQQQHAAFLAAQAAANQQHRPIGVPIQMMYQAQPPPPTWDAQCQSTTAPYTPVPPGQPQPPPKYGPGRSAAGAGVSGVAAAPPSPPWQQWAGNTQQQQWGSAQSSTWRPQQQQQQYPQQQ